MIGQLFLKERITENQNIVYLILIFNCFNELISNDNSSFINNNNYILNHLFLIKV